jgi:predicted DsbA family dithiol-disulfide isomerase
MGHRIAVLSDGTGATLAADRLHVGEFETDRPRPIRRRVTRRSAQGPKSLSTRPPPIQGGVMAIAVPERVRALEVFADVWCPFTHVGLRRIVERRAQLGRDDVVIWVRAWPLEIINGEPLGADLVAEEIHALREVVAPDLFAGFNPERFPTTSLPALTLVASAYRRDVRTGEQVSLALRTALFEEARDIADPAELAAIAHGVGMEPPGAEAKKALYDDWQEGRRRGVIGSPHFFVDNHGFFCPTLAINRVGDHLRITSDREGFEEFVSTVFASPNQIAP